MKKKNKKNVLIISDTQFPYDRKDYLDFCKEVEKKYNCGRVVHIGDIADCTNFSDYARDPSLGSSNQEVDELKIAFEDWGKAFPKMECVIGNHDNRIRRKLNAAGFSEELLSVEDIYRTIFGLPKGWTMQDKVVADVGIGGTPVYFLHGDEVGSSAVAGKTARTLGASVVRGHLHTRAFVYYISTPHHLIFDMVVGCGIDKNAVAFRYNRKQIARPIYSCSVIVDGVPQIIPMQLNKKGEWNGRV